ncbi:hypothetical protein GCM10022246_08070 [Pedobacter ginsengiterrae]|uniref:RNA polymerase sigma-70 region 2 domain-containing protein n=1 Tax=Pedobacter ginsengiterrae TaxID=871696 RepID=A0ABP7NY58_9SPHI
MWLRKEKGQTVRDVEVHNLYKMYGAAIYGSILRETGNKTLSEEILELSFRELLLLEMPMRAQKLSVFTQIHRISRKHCQKIMSGR